MAAQGCLSVQTETLRKTAAVVLLLACALVAGASASEIFRPGGEGFSLIVLVVVADVVGLALQAAVGAPPLLGHMLIGLVLKNVAALDFVSPISSSLSSTARNFALAVILLRAGLGMNVNALRRNPGLILRLAAVPNVSEALVASGLIIAVFAGGMDFGTALMGGFMLSAVSPAVVVPSLIRLQEQEYGTAKGIPTLVLAAASFDDVISISGFGLLLGIVYNSGADPVWTGFRGPVELLTGAAFGVVAGTGLGRWVLPQTAAGPSVAPPLAAALCLSVACMAVLGGKAVGFSGGGAFGAIVLGLALQHEWNRQAAELAAEKGDETPVETQVAAPESAPMTAPVKAPAEAPVVAAPTAAHEAAVDGANCGEDIQSSPTGEPSLAVEAPQAEPASVEAACEVEMTSSAPEAVVVDVPAVAAEDSTSSPDTPTGKTEDCEDMVANPPPMAAATAEAAGRRTLTGKAWRGRTTALLKSLWRFAQPMLFALIGVAVDLSAIKAEFFGYAVIVVGVAVTVRCIVAFCILLPDAFLNHWERLFLTLAWLPKATVQAAIGSLALDAAREAGGEPGQVERGLILLTLAVVSILLTAPAGALAIAYTGPRLLERGGG